jgi:hypothetical protein
MPYFNYSQYNYTTPPQTSPYVGGVYVGNNKNSITNTAKTFGLRDFLLYKNIGGIAGKAYNNLSTTQNGSPKIGQPVLDTSINNNTNRIPNSSPASVYGITFKNLNNVNNNKFYNTDSNSVNQLVDLGPDTIPLAPSIFGLVDFKFGKQPYPETPNTLIDKYGLLAKTTYKNYQQDASLKNLYNEAVKNVDMSLYIDDPYVTTAYFEANKNVIKNEGYLTQFGSLNQNDLVNDISLIGSLGGLGISNAGGLATNYDVRSSLVGRVLGATGTIKDTNIGRIGGQQLALALANNAAFNVQQEILGKLNLQDNVLSLIKGDGLAGFRPNYQITVPSSGFGKLLSGTASILGFTLPRSFISDEGSIFSSENGTNENIARANALLVNTGKGQLKALIQNANANLFGTGGYDSPETQPFRSGYAPGYRNNSGKKQINGDNIYAYTNGEGNLINPLASDDGLIPNLSFKAAARIESSGFKGDENYGPKGGKDYSESTIKQVGFTWTSGNGDSVNSIPEYDILEGSKKSLLVKTQKLFSSVGMLNMVTAKGDSKTEASQIQTTNGGGMSKGSAVLKKELFTNGIYNEKKASPSNTYARAWTTLDRYDKVSKLIRHSGLYDKPDVPYRNQIQGSVLDDNGFVKITPYINVVENPKKFMFSIENLAWNDSYFNLLPCERGSGDLLTGKKGRIMWFPPYDIQFNESSSVDWDSNKFIGRGEPVYTYSNTDRSGTLSFKIVVDHPSYINSFSGSRGGNNSLPDDNYVASFFAGEIGPDASFSKKLSSFDLDEVLVTYNPSTDLLKTLDIKKPDDVIKLHFPNDVFTYYKDYENGVCSAAVSATTGPWEPAPSDNKGCGLGYVAGQVTSIRTYNDKTNFGYNSNFNFKGTACGNDFEKLCDTICGYLLKPENEAIIVTVKGTASVPGLNDANDTLASNRADTVISILKSSTNGKKLPDANKRIRKIPNVKESNDPTGCTAKSSPDQDSKACKENRIAIIEFAIDYNLIPDKKGFTKTITTTPTNTYNPLYGECSFFEKLKQTDDFIFDKFREKIKYFHPAFHSTTPEGLNSRLTFLLQCTRQGPTLETEGANNLAFGRPPVCILRIGDFYNTKIVIDNVSFDYEPLVWDLNPEGIGVQPMIANVNMSFKFIGGSTLLGPINKLQNALSFNYFANTHVYDVRADYLAKVENPAAQEGKQPTSDYAIRNDAFEKHKNDLNKYVEVTPGNPIETTVTVKDQTKEGDAATNGVQEEIPSEPTYKIASFEAIFNRKTRLFFIIEIKIKISEEIPAYTIIDPYGIVPPINVPASSHYVDINDTILNELYNPNNTGEVTYKISLKDINSSEIYEENVLKEDFAAYVNADGYNYIFVPIKPEKNSKTIETIPAYTIIDPYGIDPPINVPASSSSSDMNGIYDSLGKETFEISLNKSTSTDSEKIKKQNIKLE